MTSGMSSARETILTKLRNAADEPGLLFRSHEDLSEQTTVPAAVTTATGSGIELARAFGENLGAVLGSYEIVEPSEVSRQIANRIEHWSSDNEDAGKHDGQLLSWAPSELPVDGLAQQLRESGFSLLVPNDLNDTEERAHAARLSVGLTGIDAAFAGTGSMVFVPDVGKSRAASLLPLHHISLVPFSKIFPTMESWLAELRNNGDTEGLFRDHAQLVFITGPSKSADIELNLTLGVHGPRDVHAILIDDSE